MTMNEIIDFVRDHGADSITLRLIHIFLMNNMFITILGIWHVTPKFNVFMQQINDHKVIFTVTCRYLFFFERHIRVRCINTVNFARVEGG